MAVVATDDGVPRLADSLAVEVTVTDVNEAPEIVAGSGVITYSENGTHPVEPYGAIYPEGDTPITWSLSGADLGDFAITNTGLLQFGNTLDYERPADSGRDNVHNVTVRASDGSLTGAKDVTVTVQHVNEAPTVTGDDTLSYPENTATTRVLDRYTAADPARGQLTWSLSGADADDFRIDLSGNMTFAEIPDYESPDDTGGNNEYQLTVVATDDGLPSQDGRFDVTVTVTPVNEPPTVNGPISHSIDENDENFAASYSASDPEGSSTTFSWSLSGTDRGDFTISQDGQLTLRNVPDYERPADFNRDNDYLLTVRASDGQYTGTLDVTVTVNAINGAPTVTGDATLSYPENTATTRVLDRYTAADPERGQLTGH